MPAVSDTSPILGLAVIGRLPLLHEQFGEIYIPLAVVEELKTETNFRGVPAVQAALQDGWLISREVQNKPLVTSLSAELNLGEDEMNALRNEIGFFISDELYQQILTHAGE